MSETTPTPESEEPTPAAAAETTPGTAATSPAAAETAVADPPPLVEPGASSATDDVIVEPAATSESEPVVATADPAVVQTARPVQSQHVVYVEAPQPPRKRGNRAIGSLLVIASAVLFAVLYAVILYVVGLVSHGVADFNFISQFDFWVPVIAFAVGFIILVLIVNRAGWAAYVIGSLFVGVFVYFATAGGLLLLHASSVPTNEVGAAFKTVLFSAVAISAALLAREVSLWVGFAIAARGRRVKVRNVEARDEYERDEAAKRAEYERANGARADAAPAPIADEVPAS
ncbi:MAG: hypothetical protein JWQ39_2684 [Glaciihabitans sp.]|nr:hypothetical protein [Glaciihabitans sp.]